MKREALSRNDLMAQVGVIFSCWGTSKLDAAFVAATAMDVEIVTLDEVFRRSDVASSHTPRLKDTEGMIQGRHFEQTKERSIF